MVEYLCSMLIVKGQIFGASFSDWKYLFIVLDMILKLFVGPMKIYALVIGNGVV